MSDIKSNRELWGVDFPVGGEWDAGYTAPAVQAGKQGRWTVRRAPLAFLVLFVYSAVKREMLLDLFPPTEQGEIEAKTFALAARENNQTQPVQ